jgi:hypothetical protein
MAFVTGALDWWTPEFVYQGLKRLQGYENITQEQ